MEALSRLKYLQKIVEEYMGKYKDGSIQNPLSFIAAFGGVEGLINIVEGRKDGQIIVFTTDKKRPRMFFNYKKKNEDF